MRDSNLEYADADIRRNLSESALRRMVVSFKRAQERRQRQGLAALPIPLIIAEGMQRAVEKR